MIGSGTLYDGLYRLNLDNLYVETLMTSHHNVGTKCSLVNECSAFLWFKRLGHISKQRMKRLVKNEILPSLDFTDLNVCVNCIKGKQTKHTKKGATRSTQLLEIITLIYVDLFMQVLSIKKGILSPLLMIFHVMVMSIYCMKNHKQ